MQSGRDSNAYELRIERVVEETHDARSFVLEVPPALRETFRYRAGQFLTFHVPWGELTLGRCYSLSSSPDCDDEHTVTVKRVEDGRVSNWFHDRVSAGDRLRVQAPAGRFVLRPESERPLALFGGGSGITPLYSIVKTALATTARRVRLLYANRDADSVIFRDELAALRERHPERLEIVHHLDAESGFVEPAAVRGHLHGWEDADFYLCGPGPFMDLVQGALHELGADADRVFVERFVSPPDGETPEVAAGPAEGEAGGVPETLVLHLDGKTHEIPVPAGSSILQAARAAGLQPPFACEEGYCGCCMARLVRGRVVMEQCSALDPDEVADGWILTCQGRPTTRECEVRYD
ncbi:MAG: ferredoxin--NADP reductase [Myxococcota bacterium]|nr:ferredoxin--NADP reductase [Myxococcota bacterium]